MNEADTCRMLVRPKLEAAGWDGNKHFYSEQTAFADGRIIVPAGKPRRLKKKFFDFLLRYTRDITLAVVEAKSNKHPAGDDILVSNIKAWEGTIAVVSPEDDGPFGSHRYPTFSPIDGSATPRYVCFCLLSLDRRHYVGEASPGSADRNPTTGSGAMQAIPVPVPRFERHIWFDQLFEKVNNAKQVIERRRLERSAMLPAILNQVFSGDSA